MFYLQPFLCINYLFSNFASLKYKQKLINQNYSISFYWETNPAKVSISKNILSDILMLMYLFSPWEEEKWHVRFLGLPLLNTINWVALTTEIYCLRVLETRSLRSRCEQSCFLLKAMRENPFYTSLLNPGGLAVSLWCSITCRWCITCNSASVFTGCSPCVYVCVQTSLFMWHRSYWIRACPMPVWLHLNYICNDLFPK